MKYTLCNEHECPKKLKCLRYTDVQGLDKSLFFNHTPYDYPANRCEYFIDVKSIKFIKDDDISNSL